MFHRHIQCQCSGMRGSGKYMMYVVRCCMILIVMVLIDIRFNERIALACHELGVDSEEDLFDVFADDELYEELRSKLRRLDQKKIEAAREKLSS